MQAVVGARQVGNHLALREHPLSPAAWPFVALRKPPGAEAAVGLYPAPVGRLPGALIAAEQKGQGNQSVAYQDQANPPVTELGITDVVSKGNRETGAKRKGTHGNPAGP